MINKNKVFNIVILSLIGIIAVLFLIWGVQELSGGPQDGTEGNEISGKYQKVIANSSVAFLVSGDVYVEEFLNIAKNKGIRFDSKDVKNCYNVTPHFISENSMYKIFKFSDTAETFLLYNDDIHKLGNNKDGYGAISFALADFNDDKEYELYFSYSWVSGIYRTNIGYFDPKEEKITGFNNLYFKDKDALLINSNGNLYVVDGTLNKYIDDTNLRFNAGKVLAEIILENSEVQLKETY